MALPQWHCSTRCHGYYTSPAAQGLPRRTTFLSRILPANKNSIHADPSETAAKARVRNSLRDRTVCLLRQL